jgi:SAM-dependent methyltransferase
MAMDIASSGIASTWERFAGVYQEAAGLPATVAHYGPDVPGEDKLRLLGDLKGKRVLELGCGAAQCSISFAKAGAIAIGVDQSSAQLAIGRRLCEEHEVKVELRHGDMAELAFLRADSIDAAFSSYSFQYVEDLNRVFRQVHRVLKVGAPLVFSLPHPAWALVEGGPGRSYFDPSPIRSTWADVEWESYPHTFSGLYMGLSRASYRIDLVLEPEPKPGSKGPFWDDAMIQVPRTLIVRARKEGN